MAKSSQDLFPELEQDDDLFPELKPKKAEPKADDLFPELAAAPDLSSHAPAKEVSLEDPLKDDIQKLQGDLSGRPVDRRGVVMPPTDREPTAAELASGLVRKAAGAFVPDLPKTPEDAVRAAAAPVLAPSAPLRTDKAVELAGAAGAGAIGSVASMAGAVPAAEAFLGIKTPVGEISQDIADELGKVAASLQPETPDFSSKLASGAGSMAAFMVPAGAVAKAASAIPKMGALAARIAPAIETGVSTVLESATEAGGVYQDMLKKGIKPEVASKAAFQDFMGNLLLVGLTNRFGIFGEKGTALAKALKSAPLEAIQEAGQSLIASASQGEAPNWQEVAESAGVGAIVGGGTGAVMTLIDRDTIGDQAADHIAENLPGLAEAIDGAEVPMEPEAVKETVVKAVAAAKEVELRGGTPEQANQAAVEVFRTEVERVSPEGPRTEEGLSEPETLEQEQELPQNTDSKAQPSFRLEDSDFPEESRKRLSVPFDSSLKQNPEFVKAVQRAEPSLREAGIDPENRRAVVEHYYGLMDELHESNSEAMRKMGRGEFTDAEKAAFEKRALDLAGRGEPLSRLARFAYQDDGTADPYRDIWMHKKKNEAAAKLALGSGGAATPPTQPPAPPSDGTIPPPQGPSPLGRPKEPKIYTERQALRQSLRKQAEAAARADRLAREEADYERRFIEAEHKAMLNWQDAKLKAQSARKVAEAKEQTRAKAKARAEEIAQIKKDIKANIEKALPLHERGKYLSVLANAKTPMDVVKAAVRVDNHVEKLIRKDLIGEIRKRAGSAVDSSKVDAFYKEKIKAVLSDIQFSRPKEETVQKLKAIERKLASDKLVRGALDPQGKLGLPQDFMPRRYLEALKVLHRKSVDELTLNELENINDKISLLENLGRQRNITESTAYQKEKAERIFALTQGTKPINRKQLIERKPGESLSITSRLRNFIRNAQTTATKMDLVLSPMDVVFDVLDGSKNYEGPNSRVIKQTLDTDYGNYLEDSRALTEPITDLAKELNMEERNFERIAVHAYRVQPNGRDYLKSGGLTDEDIDSVKLNGSEEKLYNAMRSAIERPYPVVSEVMRQLYNVQLGKIENYFPVQIDHDAVSDIELFQRMGDLMTADALGRRTKTVEQGFTKTRVGTNKKIKFNSMDVFNRHMDDVAYLLNMQRDIKMLSEVANSPEYIQSAGDQGAYLVSQWLDTMARKGGGEGMKRISWLDTLRRNFGVARLGFKLSSAIIQPTALLDGAALVGGKYVTRGLYDLAEKKWRTFLHDNIPELRARTADDPAFLELENGTWLMRKARDLGFAGLKKADLVTAYAVTAGAYRKAMDEAGKPVDLTNPDPDAVRKASLLLRRTQSSPAFKDAPLAISRGAFSGNRSIDKALFQFKSFMLNRWSLLRHDMVRAGIAQKDPIKSVWIAAYLAAAAAAETAMRMKLRGMFGEDEKDEDRFSPEMLKQLFGTIPFMGDIMAVSLYGGGIVPSWSGLEKTVESFGGIFSRKTPKGKANAIVNAASGAGSILGIPGTAQAAQAARSILRDDKKKTKGGYTPKKVALR